MKEIKHTFRQVLKGCQGLATIALLDAYMDVVGLGADVSVIREAVVCKGIWVQN
jgi:hypothetical protein